jgi:hypothetical protein
MLLDYCFIFVLFLSDMRFSYTNNLPYETNGFVDNFSANTKTSGGILFLVHKIYVPSS